MNYFTFTMGLLCIGASVQEVLRKNMLLAVVYAAWSASNFAMAFVKG